MKEIQPLESQSLQTRDFESLKTLRLACRAQNTRKAYNKGWKRFNQWLIDTGRKISEPPEGKHELLIALFVRDMTLNENLKPSTINTYVSGVKYGYRENEIEVNIAHPIIADLLSASRRIKGSAADQKSPITVEHVREIVDLMGDSPMDCIDRALILLGFGGAFRRSELVALDIDDLQFDHDGLRVRLKRSKTDQDGKARYVDIPRILNGSYCAYEALNKYMDVCGIMLLP
jgi:integrase